MKTGLTSSVIMHAAVIGFGLVSLSSPKQMQVADVEALPIDLVSIEEMTQIQEGLKDAPKADRSAPAPTSRPDIVPDAEKAGDQDQDLENEVQPDVVEKPIAKTQEAPPEAKPTPQPAPERPEPVEPEPEPKPAAEPTTELSPEPKPREEVTPEPAEQQVAALPDVAPVPEARPEREPKADEQTAAKPKPQTAETPNRKAEPAKKPAKKAPSDNPDKSIEDEVAALLNKEKASGGGAKRSTDQAALGGEKTTGGTKLSASEMDALRQQIQKCWNPPFGVADAQGLRVTVKMRLTPTGEIEGRPEVVSGGGADGVGRAAADSARRAVIVCSPYQLPADKYDAWQDVVVNFDPSQLFR
jgi:outer membrane biosynthesis protein TonB